MEVRSMLSIIRRRCPSHAPPATASFRFYASQSSSSSSPSISAAGLPELTSSPDPIPVRPRGRMSASRRSMLPRRTDYPISQSSEEGAIATGIQPRWLYEISEAELEEVDWTDPAATPRSKSRDEWKDRRRKQYAPVRTQVRARRKTSAQAPLEAPLELERPHSYVEKPTSKAKSPRSTSEDGSRRIYLSNGVIVVQYSGYITVMKWRKDRSQDKAAGAENEHLPSSRQGVVDYARLREACSCHICLDPSTKQRNFTTGQMYQEVKASGLYDTQAPTLPLHTKFVDGVNCLVIQWPLNGHTSVYTPEQLMAFANPVTESDFTFTNIKRRHLWNTAKRLEVVQKGKSHFMYDELVEMSSTNLGSTDDSALYTMVKNLQQHGFVLLKGVPTDKGDQAIREIANLIGPIRNSIYGETWDVINIKEGSKNVAYTDKDLGPHMDLLYYNDPPRFQLLHCLKNRVQGGSSYFIDSFAAALKLKETSREAFRLLQWWPVMYHYDNDGHYLRRKTTILPKMFDSRFAAVEWSPPFRAPYDIRNTGVDTTKSIQQIAKEERRFVQAIAAWEDIVNEPERKLEFTMEEGDLVIFDNRRTLHARRAFRDLTEEEKTERGVEVKEGEPARWLKGCYIDGDAVWDKLRVLARKEVEGKL